MNLTFRLRFHTTPGQSLFLSGNHPRLGDGDAVRAVPLEYLSREFWQAVVDFPADAAPGPAISYHYIVREPDGTLLHDWADGRQIDSTAFTHGELLVIDSWNHPGFYQNVFDAAPFRKVLLKHAHTEVSVPAPPSATHTFRIKAPLLGKGETLCLLGDSSALNRWNTAEPILLNRLAADEFLSVKLDLSGQSFPINYKYGVYDTERRSFIRYEAGQNRMLHDAPVPGKHTIVNDGFAVLPADTWKGAGVAIPVFSLRSENGFGVGEFNDLKPLADWARLAGLKLIQLLPINDTTASHTWTDSYPYSAISAFALHPLYLNLEALASERNRRLLKEFEPERRRLNALDAMDYESVMRTKMEFIKRVFPSQKKATFASLAYQQFFELNRDWLVPYAGFCCLRDRYQTVDYTQWPGHQIFNAQEISALADEPVARDAIELSYFIQFHLHLQLTEATEYAHSRGVVVKGDIPIGVNRRGVDTWEQPKLYHMDAQAGAPPDAFAVKGQNWGFPTYDWRRMKKDGFAWWKRRFEQMARYFDAYRIDHILGFFRIWSIPAHAVEGIMGVFDPAIPVVATEFTERGIDFDPARFTRPFITDAVVDAIFGDDAASVMEKFLDSDHAGHYVLKPAFATQRLVEKHFADVPKTEQSERIKSGLYDLLSNVILFEVAGPNGPELHFRLGMEDTLSFKNLDAKAQPALKELYIDYFFRRQEKLWSREGLEKLPALKAVTNMLMCGEDLGMVPDCVPVVMKQLGVLSLEVQRMPKVLSREFSRPAEAPYLSVVTPSTHDMSTLRGWWEEDRAITQRYYNTELGQSGEAPAHCEPWINRAIIEQHLASPAMWSIFQLQELLGMDESLRRADPAAERINVPAIAGFYWRYRMHVTLEQLQAADAFNRELNRCVIKSGR